MWGMKKIVWSKSTVKYVETTNGEKDPYKIIFVYKTGFKNEIGNAKERFGKKSKAVAKAKEMCSNIVDEVKDVCSYVSDNTCGDGSTHNPHEIRIYGD